MKDDGGNIDLKFLRMDLTDEQSIKDVKEVLAQDYGGTVYKRMGTIFIHCIIHVISYSFFSFHQDSTY